MRTEKDDKEIDTWKAKSANVNFMLNVFSGDFFT